MNQKWYERWQRNGWKNVKKQQVENKDLWERLLTLLDGLQVTFRKVEGHAGIALNERADELAQLGIERTNS
jgi:ribonuclease HI